MFDTAQLNCLGAVLDTVIPPDEYPGAWSAGVGDYLQRQLAGDLADQLPSYKTWLSQLDDESGAVHGKAFADSSLAERTHLLQRIEAGEVVSEWPLEPAGFFRKVVEHCAEGYYADPGNGGNRDRIAWQMIGFEVSA